MVSNEDPPAKGEQSKRERLMAKTRQACRLDRDPLKGIVPSGEYRGAWADYTESMGAVLEWTRRPVALLKPP